MVGAVFVVAAVFVTETAVAAAADAVNHSDYNSNTNNNL